MTIRLPETRESAVMVGSTTLAVHCAQRLVDSGRAITAVLALDSAFERWSAAAGIRRVSSLSALEELLRGEPADWLFSIVNPLLLPPSLIELCRAGAINYHDGPLPRYAGSHATFWALLARETRYAVTWHRITGVADAGDVLVQTPVDIAPADTSLSLNLKCFQAAADGFGQLLGQLSEGTAAAYPQDLGRRTFFPRKRRPHGAGFLRWESSTDELAAAARALDFGSHFFNPLCTVKAAFPDRVVQVARLEVLPDASTHPPGTVVELESDGIRVSTATNDVRIGGLSSLSGRALDREDDAEWMPRAGDRLPILTDAELAAITREHEAIGASEPFWRERLQRFRPMPWPMAQSQPGTTSTRPQTTGWIEAEPLSSVQTSARVTHVLAAFALHAAQVAGDDRLQFGFAVCGDARACLASCVPAELSIDFHASFQDLCRAVDAELDRLATHRTFALDLIARAPELRGNPGLHRASPWPVSVELVDEPAQVPRSTLGMTAALLTLQISRRDGRFRFLFDATRLSDEQVQHSIAGILERLQSPDREVSQAGLRGPDAEYPRDRCVPQLFAGHARSRPEAPAVRFGDRVMTYGELDRRSSQVAAFLRRNGIGPGSLVGICVHRSVEMVAALLGVMKSGAAYVPMDPAYPRERIAYMIDDAALPMVLTDSRARAQMPECEARVVPLDAIGEESDVPDGATAGGVAYVIYTSGSTGRPKGVKVGHRALTNLLSSMAATLECTPAGKLLAVTTICFDIAGLELYLPLVSGGAVELVSAATAADGQALRRQLEASRPAAMQATPATWKMLLHAGWTGDPNLQILCGGEALPRDLAGELVRRGREAWNVYGPTETTIWSSMSRIAGGHRVTIGRPIANTQFHLLDAELRPVPRGVPAELFIAGDGVAEGYLGRPDLTAERFLPCAFGRPGERMYRTGDVVRLLEDGEVEYLHRADRQTKLHGYRIEPGEIEYALRQHASIREAVVTLREDTPGDPRLVAYVESHAGPPPREAELRLHLKKTLPEHEIPAAFVPLPQVPRTPNGKVDYGALPKPGPVVPDPAARPVAHDVVNDLERRIATVWSQVLGRETVPVNETFFDAGGNSLLLIETVRRLQDSMGRPITSTEMFANPTVRSMAAFLAGNPDDRRPAAATSKDAIGDLRRRRLAVRRDSAIS